MPTPASQQKPGKKNPGTDSDDDDDSVFEDDDKEAPAGLAEGDVVDATWEPGDLLGKVMAFVTQVCVDRYTLNRCSCLLSVLSVFRFELRLRPERSLRSAACRLGRNPWSCFRGYEPGGTLCFNC